MLIQKALKAAREVPIEIGRFLHGAYPDFVLSRRVEALGQQVPVFMFHSVQRAGFQAQLRYLRENGYRTLDLETFLAFLQGKHRLTAPSVLLTFDDGHKSWYEVAYPLLKAHGFQAVGFVVPTYIREQSSATHWLSWPELLEMEDSGVMRFESHSAHHDQIFTGPRLLDFHRPDYPHDAMGLDIPWIHHRGDYTNALPWGTPIYTHASRYAGMPRYLDDPGVRAACVDWVVARGGEQVFRERHWRRELTALHRRLAGAAVKPAYESADAQRAALLHELRQGRERLAERLRRPVRHLCFPWGIGSDLAVALSREAGYLSSFWITHPRRNTNRPGDCPFHVARLKDDYLLRLPGRGRQPLAGIFRMKLQRRAQRLDIY